MEVTGSDDEECLESGGPCCGGCLGLGLDRDDPCFGLALFGGLHRDEMIGGGVGQLPSPVAVSSGEDSARDQSCPPQSVGRVGGH